MIEYMKVLLGMLLGKDIAQVVAKAMGYKGKGSGAALMMLILGVTGTVLCITSGQIMKKYKYTE